MKKRIFLEPAIVTSFANIKINQGGTRATRACRPMHRCQLDAPPNGDSRCKVRDAKTVFEPAEGWNHPQRILLVEDDTAARQIFCSALVRSGFHVDTAEDGEAGWNMLENASLYSNGYDLLVTDNQMPKLSGVELIQRLRSARIELPVILTSGTLPKNTNRFSVAVTLPKPFPLDLLTLTVRAVLHVARDE